MSETMPDTSNKAIGERIATVREARGLTQAAMARMIQESPQRYGQYERGERTPPPHILAKFWQLTGATSDYVLFGRTYGLPVEVVEQMRALEASKAPKDKKAS